MGLAAIYVKNNSADSIYYTHTDHLGSITEITNQNGVLMQRMAYNAWGVRELLVNNISATYPSFMFDRGYTGHEHLDQFALINMNGRLYDPTLGRMLSPDPIIQDPANSQNFNRYSYALNNPMVYTDPSGYYSGSGSSGNSYYIDGMQVSAGMFNAYMNGLDFGSYSIEGYGNEYEEFNLAIFNFEKEMKQREFRLKLEESKYILFNYKYPPIFINTSAHLYTSSFDGGGPIKKNSQSSNTATIPNFVPTLSQFMYQEASSGFGQQEATNGGGEQNQISNNGFPIVGPLLILTGSPLLPKSFVPNVIMRSFVAKGASPMTSLSSVFFRSFLQGIKTYDWLPKAASLGGQLGRVTSPLGWLITFWDLANPELPTNQPKYFPQVAPADALSVKQPIYFQLKIDKTKN